MRDKKLYVKQFMNPELDTKDELRYKLTLDSVVPGESIILQVPDMSDVSINRMHFTKDTIDKIEIYKWINQSSEERFILRMYIGKIDIARYHVLTDLYITYDPYSNLRISELEPQYVEWYKPEQLKLVDFTKEPIDEVRVV